MFAGSGGTISTMFIYAWRTPCFTGGDLRRLRACSIAMGKAHLLLE